MIHVVQNGHELGEFQIPADVVAVIVRDQQVVDLLDAGGAYRLHDPLRIARARIAGVHQHRLPARRGDERRLAALDVDEIDVQRLLRGPCNRRGGTGAGQRHGHAHAHAEDFDQVSPHAVPR
jgi:hypothetical protein